MMRPRLKTILLGFTITLTLVIITALGIGVYSFISLEKEMSAKLESKKFLLPTEFFAAPPTYSPQQIYPLKKIEESLGRQNFRRRSFDQRLLAGDYFVGKREECSARMQLPFDANEMACIGWVSSTVPPDQADSSLQIVILEDSGLITRVVKGAPFVAVPEVSGESPLLAQYIGIEPVMQKTVTLGDMPPQCPNAIMSIEDADFLEHSGFSFKSIGRAVLKNLSSGRRAQGGSTITQQLVKNYFLTSERSFKRKYQEFIMSILLESRFTKDEILETYLNVIYMGQNGPFQIRGYGAAANYYFGKELLDLQTHECALLAAIVNSPGKFNPFKNAVPSERRRNLVLTKMKDLGFISDGQFQESDKEPLPSAARGVVATETAPYYLDAVRKQMIAMDINPEGLKLYTALDLSAQEAAQDSLRSHLESLEKNNKYLAKLKTEGQSLEGAVLVGDNRTGLVSAVVGGRNFRMTQFNRAIDGHRQIGSIMKPFVFLTALLSKNESGEKYTPTTLLKDEKFNYKYERQTWSPDNYGKKYFGEVPMFYALKNSLNAATASLGIAVGLDNVIEITNMMGVTSKLKNFPAMTLGAFEMYPREVLHSYMTIANMGAKPDLSFLRQVIGQNGEILYTHSTEMGTTVDPAAAAQLVSMMKQTVLSGSARSITLSGFYNPAAGKTGTTSDNRDAWFAGFTPYLTAVVWVGYDSNKPHKLTGSNGAVPVWTSFMKKIGTRYPADDFRWPEGTETREFDEDDLRAMNAVQTDYDPLSVQLQFKTDD